MDDEVTKDLVQILDHNLAKAIYRDGLAKPTQETGKIITDVVKTARLFAAPFQLAAAYQDRFRRWIDRVIREVPEERRVPAPPQIAGPIFEELRYREEGEILTEMYLNLLSKAIDKKQSNQAHPAFVKIIGQLSPDEALILKRLLERTGLTYPLLPRVIDQEDVNEFYDFRDHWEAHITEGLKNHLTQKMGCEPGIEDYVNWFCAKYPVPDLTHPQLFYVYISHLESLNLIKPVRQRWGDIKADWINTSLTDFGNLFVEACERTGPLRPSQTHGKRKTKGRSKGKTGSETKGVRKGAAD